MSQARYALAVNERATGAPFISVSAVNFGSAKEPGLPTIYQILDEAHVKLSETIMEINDLRKQKLNAKKLNKSARRGRKNHEKYPEIS